nr:hypothetical protein [Bacteroidota bacterium]
MAFSCSNPSQVFIAEENFENGILEYVVSPNGTVFIGERSDACGCYVYIYNWDLTPKGEEHFYATNGCVKEFDFLFGLDYFVFTSMCDSRIYFFQDSETSVSELGNCYVPHPYTFAYNEDEFFGYSFRHDPSGIFLYKINLTTFSASHVAQNYNFNKVNELFYNPNDDLIYGISESEVYKISNGSVLGTFDLNIYLDIANDNIRDDDFIFDLEANRLYVPVIREQELLNSKKVLSLNLDDGVNEFYHSGLAYQKSTLIFFPSEKYNLFGKSLTYYPEKQNLYCAQQYFSGTTIATEHLESRTLTGNYDWISFPSMPRLGNTGYNSQELLENLNPLPENLELNSMEGTSPIQLTYDEPIWDISEIPFIVSTQGYIYNSNSPTEQSLPVTGIVLDPSTPIQLFSGQENWIGYFLEYPLSAEDAFRGIWYKLTRISTEEWTIYLRNGLVYAGTGHETPINYGDGLIVEVSEDCSLTWDYASEPVEDFEYPATEYFSYEKQASYLPFYFETDSISGVQEIGLTVYDTCVGAAVVQAGDTMVEVNAYLAGIPSGAPIEVETWSGFKSAKIEKENYSIVDPFTRKRTSRKIYTGERQPFYIISFKSGESNNESPVMILQHPSPNPFSEATQCSFILNGVSDHNP